MTAEASQPPRRVRVLRHWKQRFDRDARMVFRKRTAWTQELQFEPGDEVPPEIIEQMGPTKLRRFWEAHQIELHGFEDPDVGTGQVEPAPEKTDPATTEDDESELPLGVSVSGPVGGWYTISDGEGSYKARGKEKLLHVLESIREERAAQDEATSEGEGTPDAGGE